MADALPVTHRYPPWLWRAAAGLAATIVMFGGVVAWAIDRLTVNAVEQCESSLSADKTLADEIIGAIAVESDAEQATVDRVLDRIHRRLELRHDCNDNLPPLGARVTGEPIPWTFVTY